MRKGFSILIVPSSKGRARSWTISQLGACVLGFIFICILGSVGWLIFEYGNICKRSLEISALREENQRLQSEYEKLILFEREFADFKLKTLKIANMLGIEQICDTSIILSSSTPNPEGSSLHIMSPEVTRPQVVHHGDEISVLLEEDAKKQRSIPSIYPVKGWLTKRFSSDHPGIDFASPLGTPVLATMDGVIEYSGFDETLGNLVKVTNESGSPRSGFTTVYGHLSRASVQKGNKVRCGDLIGFVGSTGKSSTPHLHYEVWENGTPHDPESYLIREEVR